MKKTCKTEYIHDVLNRLDRYYGNEVRCYLTHQNAGELLIATILSAQCTDARVNIVTHRITSYNVCYTKLLRFREIKKHRNITGKEKHLEPFYYPVWIDSNQVKMKKEKPWIICFDYTKRNPLTYEAFYEEISYS